MATEVEHIKMVYTDAKNNNNKFWEGILFDDNSVKTVWGRVGATSPQSKDFPSGGKSFLDKKAREKEKKGYRAVKTADGTVGGTPSTSRDSGKKVSNAGLKDIAKRELGGGKKEIEKLVERLAEVNRHQIAAASGGKITVSTNGLVTTILGDVVDLDTISEARDHLDEMATALQKPKTNFDAGYWLDPFNEYLKCIPQDVGHTQKHGWHKTLFTSLTDIQKQNAFLDQLEASIKNAMSASQKKSTAKDNQQRVFETKIDLVNDQKIIKYIENLYNKTAKSMHSCYGHKVHKVFSVEIPSMKTNFDSCGKKMNNIWDLWHGTDVANVLSILKGGYVVPPSNAGHVTGRMFGPGVYFSDQSTKSLNYAYGYWSGSYKNDSCFMFMNKVAMGNFKRPNGPISTPPPKGYDSYFAEGGRAQVSNNEMIVQRTDQINIEFLVEFKK